MRRMLIPVFAFLALVAGTGGSPPAISGAQGAFYTLAPCRVLDTRLPPGPFGGPPLKPGDVRAFDAVGVCAIPPEAVALSVNVTVTNATAGGVVNIYQAGIDPPGTFVLAYRAGQTRANNAIVSLGGTPRTTFLAITTSSGPVDLIVDVSGYFDAVSAPPPTRTSTLTPTSTPTSNPTSTPTPSSTPTRTPTVTFTRTPTSTPASSSTPTPTLTPTLTPTPTASPSTSVMFARFDDANVVGTASADFDGDGNQDLVNTGAYVLLGSGKGFFRNGGYSSSGTNGESTGSVVADFNGDGKPDFATLYSANSNSVVSVQLGDGTGNLRDGVLSPIPVPQTAPIAGDFNGDGKVDLAFATADGLSLLKGNGDGTFRPAVTFASAGYHKGIATGDLNGDGNLDLVVTNPQDYSITVWLGSGGGSFQPGARVVTGNFFSYPYKVAVGDFNRDGKLDIAITNFFAPTVTVLIGKGDGTFQLPASYPAGPQPTGLAVVDLNGDGKLDLAVTNFQGADTVSILLGNGDGTFRAPVSVPAGRYPDQVVVGDFNNDGKPDLLIGTSLLINTTGSAVQPPVLTSTAPREGVWGPLYNFAFKASGVPEPHFVLTNASFTASQMSLGADGVLTGRPMPGVYSGRVTAGNTIVPNATQDFAVLIRRASQTITFPPIPDGSMGGAFYMSATASSGLRVTYVSLTPSICSVNNSAPLYPSLAVFDIGSCVIRAEQAGDGRYAPAPSVDRSFIVSNGPWGFANGVFAFPADGANFVAPATITLSALLFTNSILSHVGEVDFYHDEMFIGLDHHNSDNPYSVVWRDVPAGTYTLTARATLHWNDRGRTEEYAGNTYSSPITIAVSPIRDEPGVMLTAPANQSLYVAPASISIAAAATDPAGTIAKVEFYSTDTLLGTATSAPYTLSWANVPAGAYSLTAKATNSIGATSSSPPIAVVVDSGIPTPVAAYTFNDSWMTSGRVQDILSGFDGILQGNVVSSPAPAIAQKPDTCQAAGFSGGVIDVHNLSATTVPGAKSTVAFWMYWSGGDEEMPLSWATQGLIVSAGSFGFTTFNGDLFGVAAAPLASSWHHVVAQFNNGGVAGNKLYIDGVPQALTQQTGTPANANAVVGGDLRLGGRSGSADMRFIGLLDDVEVFNGMVTADRVTELYTAPSGCASLTVMLAAPGNNSEYRAPASVQLVGGAASQQGSITRIEFYSGTTLVGTASGSGVPFTWTGVQPGRYVLTAKAFDTVNAMATSNAVTVNVTAGERAERPRVALLVPVDNSSYFPGTIELHAFASGAPFTTVEFLANGALLGPSAPLAFSQIEPYLFYWRNVPVGSYVLTAKATDARGGIGISNPVNITVVPLGPPTMNLVAPVGGSQYALGQTITLTAEVALPTLHISRVEFYSDGSLIGTDLVSGGPSAITVNLAWTGASVGAHSLSAKAFATDGGSAVSAGVGVTVVDLAVGMGEPFPGETYLAPAGVRITTDPTETGGAVTSMDFYGDGVLLGSRSAPPFTFLWTSVPAGPHTVTGKAHDSSGLVVSSSVAITVITAPTIQIDAGIDGSTVADDNVSVSGTVQAPPNSAVIVGGRGAALGRDGRFFIDNVPLQPGSNTINVSLNTQDADSITRSITLTRAALAAFGVSLDKWEGVAPFTAVVALTNRSVAAFGRVEMDLNGDGAPEVTVTTLTNGQATQTIKFPTPGIYTLGFKVFDTAGTLIFSTTRKVRVFGRDEIGYKVVRVYTTLVDRLSTNDPAGALRVFTGDAQQRYADTFGTLAGTLPGVAAQLGEVVSGVVWNDLGELMIARGSGPSRKLFTVHLVRGSDGIWRVEDM